MTKMAEDPKYMSIYITDYLEPLLFKMRSERHLKIGKKKWVMRMSGSTPVSTMSTYNQRGTFEYEGELDE